MKKRIQPHIRLGEGDVADVVFIAGNPDRVPKIAAKMKDAKEIGNYRGLVSYQAYTPKGVEVTVATSGMGTPSTHIVIEELANLGAKIFIRIGSCGGVNPEIKTGDVVVATGAVRDELTGTNYAPLEYPAVATAEIYSSLLTAIWELLPADRIHAGIVWSTDIYYNHRGAHILDQWTRANVQCVEMESSLLFVFAQTRGLQAGSILACDGNLHGDQKGEQKDETEQSGEQNPLLNEAISKEIEAAIKAVDELYASD
ncbi:MAG: nucleoside phosphorylase [Promethearchaeota archaeon]